MNEKKQKFIEFLLESEVLKFGDFVTKSGRNTPYFINTGLYKNGYQLTKLAEFYADMVYDTLKDDYTALFGPAYKGISLACMTSSVLFTKYGINKFFLYNRKEAKDHGEGGTLIGYTPKKDDNIIIIEDVITAGTAVREVLPLIQDKGASVLDMFVSVNRREVGTGTKSAIAQLKDDYGINVHWLVDVYDIYEYLKSSDDYKNNCDKMKEYMEKYCI